MMEIIFIAFGLLAMISNMVVKDSSAPSLLLTTRYTSNETEATHTPNSFLKNNNISNLKSNK